MPAFRAMTLRHFVFIGICLTNIKVNIVFGILPRMKYSGVGIFFKNSDLTERILIVTSQLANIGTPLGYDDCSLEVYAIVDSICELEQH